MTGKENYAVIGTAGHVDHGKTMLVQALTGKWLDRLEEEKRRGMTIELGFTRYVSRSKIQAAIVDVPGHESLVKTMIRGAASIDLVLFVVDGSEGIMPQSREHLDVLTCLGLRQGIIVLTKTDLLTQEKLSSMKEKVVSACSGSFLEDAPVVCTSALTGEGISQLEEVIDKMLSCGKKKSDREAGWPEEASEKQKGNPAFFSIDKMFSVPGTGSVVTGTLRGAPITRGQKMWVYPGAVPCRVRGIQIHFDSVDRALPGRRIAVNLANIGKEELAKAGTVASVQNLEVVKRCRMKLLFLPGKVLNNKAVYHVHVRGEFATCRIKIEEGEAEVYFDRPVLVFEGDRAVFRTGSPVLTVGGGTVLCAGKPHRPVKKSKNSISPLADQTDDPVIAACFYIIDEEDMLCRSEGHGWSAEQLFIPSADMAGRVVQRVQTCGCDKGMSEAVLIKRVEAVLLRLYKERKIFWIPEGYYITKKSRDIVMEKLVNCQSEEKITMIRVKEEFGVSRKYARLIFSLSDREGVTKKTEGESERVFVK